MKIFLLIIALTVFSGCSSTASKGAMSRAEKNLNKGDYQDTISIVDRAMRTYGDTYSDEQKARLLFLKAQSYQKLRDKDNYLITMSYLIKKYPETEHGYKANFILNKIGK